MLRKQVGTQSAQVTDKHMYSCNWTLWFSSSTHPTASEETLGIQRETQKQIDDIKCSVNAVNHPYTFSLT